MIICGSGGTSGKSMSYSSQHEDPIWTKHKQRMVQQII